jgi:phage-related protein (TIGR01555 family)
MPPEVKAFLDGDPAKALDQRTLDSFNNYILQLGNDTDNALAASTYGFNPITRIRTLLEWIHRGSWLGGVAIDLVAEDMVKMGIQFTGEIPPDDIQTLQKGLIEHGVWDAICDTVKWGRLYGGALGCMLIDGQDLSTPLRIDTIREGQFRGMLSLDRWMVEPDLINLVTDYGPSIGMPKYYRVTSDAPALNLKVLHYSRCLRVDGIKLPYWQRVMENLWGISVLERLYDRMIAFDAATQGAAQLVHKMFLRIFKIKGLREIASSNSPALKGLLAYLQIMRRAQSNEGITMIDAEDDYVPHQQTVNSGISDTLARLGEQLCGALQIPAVRLFGMSPGGLNSTGESDLRMYYDGIRLQQNQKLRVPLTKIIRVLARSLGVNLPKSWGFEFVPLWQMTEEEKSKIALTDVQTVNAAEERKLVSQRTAMLELKQSSIVTGRFTNISEEDIEAADESIEPPQAEELMEGGGSGGSSPDGEEPEEDGEERPGAGGARTGDRRGDEHWEGRLGAEDTRKRQRGVSDQHLPISEYLGIPVVIECPAGIARWAGGPAWPADYGYIRGTHSAEGKDEPVDCFIGPVRQSEKVFIINHFTDGRFEEHKVMLGYNTAKQAQAEYEAAYNRKSLKPAELQVGQLMAALASVDPLEPWPVDGPSGSLETVA